MDWRRVAGGLQDSILELDVLVEEDRVLLGKRLDLLEEVLFFLGEELAQLNDMIDQSFEVEIEVVEEVALLGGVQDELIIVEFVCK